MQAKDRDKYNQYMREYLKKRYWDRRKIAINALGGKCVRCGSVESLEIDHVDPKKKQWTAHRIANLSMDKFLSEIGKCQLLCDPCHNLKTLADKGQKPAIGTHGTLSAYRYCKCEECKAVASVWNRRYRENRARNSTAE